MDKKHKATTPKRTPKAPKKANVSPKRTPKSPKQANVSPKSPKKAKKVAEKENPLLEFISPTSGRKRRRVKRQKEELPLTLDMPGIKKIIITAASQKILKCIVGKDVTTENPWKYVLKEDFEYILDVDEDSSEFLPIKNKLLAYPKEEILISYISDEIVPYHEFYICTTEEGEAVLANEIRKIKEQREIRFKNTVFKSIKPWESQGSEVEIEEPSSTGNRSLLEIEIEARYPIPPISSQFRLRLAENAKDGYVEILSTRFTFLNITRARIDSGVQIVPSFAFAETQTVSYYRNSSTQHQYIYHEIKNPSKAFKQNIKSFMATKLHTIDKMLYINHNFNFYENDYAKLVRNQRYSRAPKQSCVKLLTSLINQQKDDKRKVISSLSWHPSWKDFLAIAYADDAPSNYIKNKSDFDEVLSAIFAVTPISLWSCLDNTAPVLFLETYREVTALSFCPYNENILVGGCFSGLVIIWDLENKFVEEKEEILTPTQLSYRLKTQHLISWIKNVTDTKTVKATVLTAMRHSHRSAVTSIHWVPSSVLITNCGKISKDGENSSLQFATSSRDGSILFWDLLDKHSGFSRHLRKPTRLKSRPTTLTKSVSALRSLNRVFKPIFKIDVLAPDTNRNAPLMGINIINEISHNLIQDKDRLPPNHFLAGTTEGDVLTAIWEGYDVSLGATVNSENCRIHNFVKFHDGPILSITSCKQFSNLVLTVGGKVFAMWKINFLHKPFLWRKSSHRYTGGMWNSLRPSFFYLTRVDGYMEIWNLNNRTDRYQYLEFITAGDITGIYEHPPHLKANVVGLADCKGVLRKYYVTHTAEELTKEHTHNIYKMCEKEIDRKQKFIKWQQEWRLKHSDLVALKEAEALAMHKQEEEMQKELQFIDAAMNRIKGEDKEASSSRPKTAFSLSSKSLEWKQQQFKRMSATLLKNKQLNMEVLHTQQLPLIKVENEENIKKIKQAHRLNKARQSFEKTVTTHFPDITKKTPPVPDPYAGGDFLHEKAIYIQNYRSIVETSENFIDEHKYLCYLRWLEIIENAKTKMKKRVKLYKYPYSNQFIKDKHKQYQDALLAQKIRDEMFKNQNSDPFNTTFYNELLAALKEDDLQLSDILLTAISS